MDKNIELWKQMLESQLEEVEPIEDDVNQPTLVDDAALRKLDELQNDCKKSSAKFMKDRFNVYGYEGQILNNIFNNLSNVIVSLKNGKIDLDMCKHLELAISNLYYADRHKTPGPTDPRDIR